MGRGHIRAGIRRARNARIRQCTGTVKAVKMAAVNGAIYTMPKEDRLSSSTPEKYGEWRTRSITAMQMLDFMEVVERGLEGTSDAAVSADVTQELQSQSVAEPEASSSATQASAGDGDTVTSVSRAAAPVVLRGDQQGRLPNTPQNRQIDRRARFFLTNAVDGTLTYLVNQHQTAKGLWNAINQKFADAAVPVQQQLEKDMLFLVKGMDESMQDYLSRAESLRDRMFSAGLIVKDSHFVGNVIRGLPDEYSLETVSLYCQTSPPTYPHVVKVLTSAEIRVKRSQQARVMLSDAQAHAVGYVPKKGKPRYHQHHKPGQRGPCYECGRMGHLQAQCPERRRPQQQPGGQLQGGKGPKRGPGRANVALAYHVAKPAGQSAGSLGTAEEPVGQWMLDSGASRHICSERAFFSTLKYPSNDDQYHEPQSVKIADGTEVPVRGVGSVLITAKVDGAPKEWELVDCLYVPGMHANLISTGQLGADYRAPVMLVHRKKTCDLHIGSVKYATASTVSGVPLMDSYTAVAGDAPCEEPAMASAVAVPTPAVKATVQPTPAQLQEAKLWHRRFGHLSMSSLAKLVSMVEGISTTATAFIADPLCEPCIKAKMARAPFTSSDAASSSILQVLHMDLSGPIEPPTIGGARYLATFTDDYSKWCEVKLLQHKSGLAAALEHVVLLLENQSGKTLKAIRSDRGGEFVNWKVDAFLSSKGIAHQKTVPYSPQQNGVAERMNRTLMDKARAMLFESDLQLNLWGEAAMTACYLRNRSPAAGISMTPFEAFWGKKPDVSNLRVFGCAVWAKVPDQFRKKLDPKAVKGIFVGYAEGNKGYRVWLRDKPRKITTSRDVVFDEGGPAVTVAKPAAEKTLLLSVFQFCRSLSCAQQKAMCSSRCR